MTIPLTPKERAVMDALAANPLLSYIAIAAAVGTGSPKTARQHVCTIAWKLALKGPPLRAVATHAVLNPPKKLPR